MFRKPKDPDKKTDEQPKVTAQAVKPQVIIRPSGPRLMHGRLHDLDSVDHPNVYVINPADGEVLTYEEATQKWVNKVISGMVQHGNEWHTKTFIEGADVPANELDPSVDATLKGITLNQVRDHTPKAHETSHLSGGGDDLPWGAGGGLDVDKVDGLHASEIAGGTVGKGFKAYLTVVQDIPSETWTKVQLNAEVFDDYNEFNTTNYVFIPQATGNYLILARAPYVGIDDGAYADIALYCDETTLYDPYARLSAAATGWGHSPWLMALAHLIAGYHYYLYVNRHGSNQLITGQSNTFISITRQF